VWPVKPAVAAATNKIHAQPVLPDLLVRMVPTANLAMMELRVRVAHPASPAITSLQDHQPDVSSAQLARKATPDPLARLELPEEKVNPVQKAEMANPAQAPLAQLVLQAPLARPVDPVLLETKVRTLKLVPRALRVRLVKEAQTEMLAIEARMVPLANQAQLAPPDHLDQLAATATVPAKDNPVRRVPRAHLVPTPSIFLARVVRTKSPPVVKDRKISLADRIFEMTLIYFLFLKS